MNRNRRDVVEADSDGRFSLRGVDRGRIAISVCCPVPPEPEDPEERLRHLSTYGRTPMNPVLFCRVGRWQHDLGDIELPRLGSLVCNCAWRMGPRLAMAVCSGRCLVSFTRCIRLAWTRKESRGSTACRKTYRSTSTWRRSTPTLGELQARFSVDRVVDGTVGYRVTGAGTVVLRLESNGAPVEVPWASFDPAVSIGAGFEGRASEFRGWMAPGIYSNMRVEAPGYAPCLLPSVTVRDDGPTYVTAQLERL